MLKQLEKSLTTVFILGVVVSFSSALFIMLFVNFTVIPLTPLVISLILCVLLQISAYLGGVVFRRRIWPAILMIVCSVATAWVGVLGPASIFGLPATIAENYEKGLVSPIYFATVPVTLVGLGVGIAYLVVGITALINDAKAVQPPQTADAKEPLDKAALYAQVSDLLRHSDGEDLMADTPGISDDSTVPPAEEPPLEKIMPATQSDDLGEDEPAQKDVLASHAAPEASIGIFTRLKEFFVVDADADTDTTPAFAEEEALPELTPHLPTEAPLPDASEHAVPQENHVESLSATENEAPPVQTPAALADVPFITSSSQTLLDEWKNTPHLAVPPAGLNVVLDTEHLRILRLDGQGFTVLLDGISAMEKFVGLPPSGEVLDADTQQNFSLLWQQAMADEPNYKWYAVWLITTKNDNKLIGSAGFAGAPGKDAEVSLNFSINEAHRESTYGAEAVVALCRWALIQNGVCAVSAETDTANVASVHLMETAGMTQADAADAHLWHIKN